MTEEPRSERRPLTEVVHRRPGSWARACATRPWRVVGARSRIMVTLVFLVAAIGGTLKDEFEISGSDLSGRSI